MKLNYTSLQPYPSLIPGLASPAAQAAGARWPCRGRTKTGRRRAPASGGLERSLDRLDRVLERAVVELHHVLAALPPPSRPRVRLTWTTSKPPEPSPRSSAATLTTTSSPSRISPSSAGVGPGRPALAVDLDGQRVLVDDDAAAQLQAAAHAGPGRRGGLGEDPLADLEHRRRGGASATHSSGVCGPPRCRWRAGRSRRRSTQQRVDVAAAAGRGPHRLEAGPRIPASASAERARGARQLVAAEQLFDLDVDVAAVLARPPGAGLGHLARDLGGPPGVDAARLGEDPAVAGDDVARGPALDQRRRSPSSPRRAAPAPSARSPPRPRRSRCCRPRG